jgi:hypothetical protein
MAKKLALLSETPAAAGNDDKILVTAYIDKALAVEIDEFRWTSRIEGRAETVRQLIIRGLRPDNA